MKPLPPDKPEGRMLIGIFFRLITGVLAVVGFLVFVVWTLLDVTRYRYALDHLPAAIGGFLLLCLLCYGCWDVLLSWRKPHSRSSDEKTPHI